MARALARATSHASGRGRKAPAPGGGKGTKGPPIAARILTRIRRGAMIGRAHGRGRRPARR
jgi:hypothetical protein